MRKLESTMKGFVSFIFVCMFPSAVCALEVTLHKDYYRVDPHSVDAIEAAIITASTLQSDKNGKAVGQYDASTLVTSFEVEHNDGYCRVNEFELTLNGAIVLPELSKKRLHTQDIIDAFEQHKQMIETHELQHESIWVGHLQNFEKNVRVLRVEDNPQCDVLIDDINQKMINALSEILFENRSFDCMSYGKELHLHECEQ